MHAEDYNPETILIIVLLIFILAFIGGCALPQPEPIVIERACAFAELNPKSKLPPVDFIKPDEGCAHYRCLDEKNALLLKEREVLLRYDSNYARELYLETKERCTK